MPPRPRRAGLPRRRAGWPCRRMRRRWRWRSANLWCRTASPGSPPPSRTGIARNTARICRSRRRAAGRHSRPPRCCARRRPAPRAAAIPVRPAAAPGTTARESRRSRRYQIRRRLPRSPKPPAFPTRRVAELSSMRMKSTVPAMVVRSPSMGNRLIRLMPERPDDSAFQLSSLPWPSEVRTPVPVTTIDRPSVAVQIAVRHCSSPCSTTLTPTLSASARGRREALSRLRERVG